MSTMVLSALSDVPDFVIEDHVAATNDFFKGSKLKLDDLHVYANPMSIAAQLVMRGAHRPVSDAEIIESIRLAMAEYRGIDYALERAADAEDRAAGLARTGN